jgi:TetR/AcrR family transcriptional regulator
MDKPGSRRGRAHDAEGTREAILDAAEAVFAEHGFDGARIDAIAAAAGYNKSLIFQYYSDKLGLYAEVIRRADDQTRDLQNEALASLNAEDAVNPQQLRSLLAGFVGWYFDYLVQHPHIKRIYLWEMAEGWQTFSKILSQRDYDDIDDFMPVLQKLQALGLLRSELHPILQLSPALFMCITYLEVLPLYAVMMPGLDTSSPAVMRSAKKFVMDFVVNGLLVNPSEAKP